MGVADLERDHLRERYYEHRAPVYDTTSYRGDPDVDAALDRETGEIGSRLAALSADRVLDVGCGTAVWTRYLGQRVVAVDQSLAMCKLASGRVPRASVLRARFPSLPFADRAFDVVFTANVYGLLQPDERARFLAEAARLGRELVVVDLRSEDDELVEGIERREVGSATYSIFRRRFTPESLRDELDGELLYAGRYFLAVRTKLPS